MTERWMPSVTGYEASDHGRLRSARGVLTPRENPQRRAMEVTLHIDGKRYAKKIHHLVLAAFGYERPPGSQCRHLDGNPQNNRLDNLAWGTQKENEADKLRHGTRLWGEKIAQAKLSSLDVHEIRRLIASRCTGADIAKKFNVSQSTICDIKRGRTWRNLDVS